MALYEVRWSMQYETDDPNDAVFQAIGHLNDAVRSGCGATVLIVENIEEPLAEIEGFDLETGEWLYGGCLCPGRVHIEDGSPCDPYAEVD